MSDTAPAFHYVCTPEEAWEIVQQNHGFWLSNCGCRENHGHCRRSRVDLCLQFRENTDVRGSSKREVSLAEIGEIFQEAKLKRLVMRPFRRDDDRTVTDGICFCCDDCCEYFTKPEEICDKGRFIESTDLAACTQCGICEDICYFMARNMIEGGLVINRDFCYGCGLCVKVCPEGCVAMISRS